MDYSDLTKKRCFIFPYSPASKILKNELEKNNIFFKGFIDSNAKGSDIFTLKKAIEHEFDYIIIYSENHLIDIYKQTINFVNPLKILSVTLSSDTNKFIIHKNTNKLIESKKKQEKYLRDYFLQKQENYQLENSILLVGLEFIDLNIKYLYLYIKKHTNYNVYLATKSLRDIKKFKNHGIEVINYHSLEFINLVFQCKVKIVDHSPVESFLIQALNIGSVIQLWHGVTVKMLGTQANYKAIDYDIVLSTSEFVSDYSFSKLYNYKHIINCGYPRNDILHFNDIELINIDLELLQQMKNNTSKYVIYMPTYRPLGFENNPINYKKLNEFGKINNIKFIIKMHPFIGEKIRDSLNSYKENNYNYTNVIIYDASMDIYPLLKYSDILLADYSSVYFDYLFVDKPIVFFPYDYEEWVESADGTMLNYFDYTPGDMYYTFDKMLDGILKNLKKDDYKEDRKKIRNQIFLNQTQKASKLILNEIERLIFDIKK